MNLTKASEKELMNYHAGSGFMFLSEGTGKEYTKCDIRFLARNGKHFLAMGNSEAVELTEDQAKTLGNYAKTETE